MYITLLNMISRLLKYRVILLLTLFGFAFPLSVTSSSKNIDYHINMFTSYEVQIHDSIEHTDENHILIHKHGESDPEHEHPHSHSKVLQLDFQPLIGNPLSEQVFGKPQPAPGSFTRSLYSDPHPLDIFRPPSQVQS